MYFWLITRTDLLRCGGKERGKGGGGRKKGELAWPLSIEYLLPYIDRACDMCVHQRDRRQGGQGGKKGKEEVPSQPVLPSLVLTPLVGVASILRNHRKPVMPGSISSYFPSPSTILHGLPSRTRLDSAIFPFFPISMTPGSPVMRLPIQPSTHQSIHPPMITITSQFLWTSVYAPINRSTSIPGDLSGHSSTT